MTATSIVGFDSAWTDQVRAPGAVCVLRCNDAGITFLPPRLATFAQALETIEHEASLTSRTLVAIDQPTLVPNAIGSRPVDKVAASLVSWLGGGVQPANRSKLGMFDDGAPIWKFKRALAAVEDPEAARSAQNGRFIIEIFPALAIPTLAVEFCGRLLGARYNPGRRKTFNHGHWLGVLECAAAAGDRLGIRGLSEWCRSPELTGHPKKSDQDQLDSVLCAIVGYAWLFQARSDSLMIGDTITGYIITPAAGLARERLLAAAAHRDIHCR